MPDSEEDIRISDIEEKISLNFVQNLLVIASQSEEEFDFSPSNVATHLEISNKLDILEKYHILRVIHLLSLI